MERYFLLSSANTSDNHTVLPDAVLCHNAPEEVCAGRTPTPMPSCSESIRAMMMESQPSSTETTPSSSSSLRMLGTNSSEIPWMRCLPTL